MAVGKSRAGEIATGQRMLAGSTRIEDTVKFRLRTLFVIIAIVGFVLHLIECLRGGSIGMFIRFLSVFYLGTIATFFFSTLAGALVGNRAAWVGGLTGILFWVAMIWYIDIFDGEINRFTRMHFLLIAFVTAATIWTNLVSPPSDESKSHSIEKLSDAQRARKTDDG